MFGLAVIEKLYAFLKKIFVNFVQALLRVDLKDDPSGDLSIHASFSLILMLQSESIRSL